MALFRDVLFSNYCDQTQKRNGLKFGLICAKFKLFALLAANAMSEHALARISKIKLSDVQLLTSLALISHLKFPEFHLREKSSQTFVLCPC